jgi:hypothetical protein
VEIRPLDFPSDVSEMIYTTRKTQNGKIYLMDPIIATLYSLENGRIDNKNSINLGKNLKIN